MANSTPKSESLIFDPDGDLVLVLERPTEDDTESGGNQPDRPARDLDQDSSKTADGASNEPVNDVVQIRMQVSSKHLTLVSPVFKAMFQAGAFIEGQRLALGKSEVSLPDDDPEAMTIVLNVIHSRMFHVPKKIDIETATHLAVLVDKYDICEVVSGFSDSWLEGVMDESPIDVSTMMEWIFISWVFNRKAAFNKATILATQESIQTPEDQYLPIPEKITDAILKNRQKVISDLIGHVKMVVKKYQSTTVNCGGKARIYPSTELYENESVVALDGGRACDAMVLGCLIKDLTLGTLWPDAETSLWTARDVYELLCKLSIKDLCGVKSGSIQQSSHFIGEHIESTATQIYGRIRGLNLQDFKSQRKKSNKRTRSMYLSGSN